VRIIATFLVMGGPRYNWKERLFYALAWTPKATVQVGGGRPGRRRARLARGRQRCGAQSNRCRPSARPRAHIHHHHTHTHVHLHQASLSAVPLSLITRVMVDSPDYAQWVQWGEDMLATGIFAIIVCASLGTLAVHWLAPVLLEREVRVWGGGVLRAHAVCVVKAGAMCMGGWSCSLWPCMRWLTLRVHARAHVGRSGRRTRARCSACRATPRAHSSSARCP
jgi:hypothetical protein